MARRRRRNRAPSGLEMFVEPEGAAEVIPSESGVGVDPDGAHAAEESADMARDMAREEASNEGGEKKRPRSRSLKDKGFQRKLAKALKRLKRPGMMKPTAEAKWGLGALGAVGMTVLLRQLLKQPGDFGAVERSVVQAERSAKTSKIAELMKQAREEKSLEENKRRLAQSAPDLYSSVMAGQRLPRGSVVLGGQPREDLMRQLAASMGSGRFRKEDPLSELMG